MIVHLYWAIVLAAVVCGSSIAAAQTAQPEAPEELVFSDQPQSVAVLDFRVIGEGLDPAAGEALATVIRSAIVRAGGVRLIERQALADILKEQDLQVTDIVDPATAVELGRIAGVDWLVLGSIASLGRTHTVTSRVVDVTTGEAAEAEEFSLRSLDEYARVGRLLAALIGEQPIGQDSIAASPHVSDTFDGKKCKLTLGPLKDPRNRTALDEGRFVMHKASKGNHYWWVPGVKGDFYMQVDLAQLSGPPRGACGVIWGARGTGDYLSVVIDGKRRVWIERRQGGTTSTTLAERRDWPVVNPPPRSNRIRLESWEDRHRVFVNGVCLDDFYEPGYREGKVGLRASLHSEDHPAQFAADNLLAGSLRPATAGIGTEEPTAKARPADRPRKKPRSRSAPPWATIKKVRVQQDVQRDVRGVTVHVAFEVGNLKGKRLHAAAMFADARTGKPLADRDGRYRTPQGRVAAVRSFSPRYRKSTYSDLTLFIPRSQLHLRPGQSALTCRASLWDDSRDPGVMLGVSGEVKFTLRPSR
ncbi:MAG: CsgG/HfaB family protein [Planctomycetota bacterium]|jgi:curli biogenesis system outer membrane secretion channel CsgG